MNFTRTNLDGGECQLRIEGALDALTVRELVPTLDALVAEKPARVRVDLEALTLIDSSGVGAIVSLFKRVRSNGGEVRVVNAKEQPLAVLKLLRLDKVLGL